ncbi:MAG TPA: linear amide C-N hydrolase [Acidimicrobiales bacterium]|jgi:choloylglycine hydrolase|nr:linear amide C-N hydrolase [Acidimicrobiales bacterium]
MCSRIFWSGNGVADVAARTLDWAEPDNPQLWVLPRGLQRTGEAAGTEGGREVSGPEATPSAIREGPLAWTSRYGSLSVTGFETVTTEALNEAGLAVHVLYLEETAYEAGTDERPTVANACWAQWLADTCATVEEAVEAMDGVRITSAEVRGQHLGAHLALEDSSGDSAIVEILDGRMVVHHGREHRVMTNDPDYDRQLENLALYRPFGGDRSPPGDILSTDRFVRASYFLHHLPSPATVEEAVAGAVLVSRNVWVPPGAPYDDFSVYPTWWGSAVDVTNRVYYFQAVSSPNLIWVGLDELDLDEGAPILSLDPFQPGMVGEVAGAFVPTARSS